MIPKPPSASYTETVQVVLPNDANPLGYILGGTVMHLVDIAGAIAAHRHARSQMVTAAVDGLQFLHPIRVGDLIVLQATVTAAFTTSLEVEVRVFSESLAGERRLTSHAYLTFATIEQNGVRPPVPPLIAETDDDRARAAAAAERRKERLARRQREVGGILQGGVRNAEHGTDR
jgi:acyl-CoA hydrolase